MAPTQIKTILSSVFGGREGLYDVKGTIIMF